MLATTHPHSPAPRELWPHQQKAVSAACAALEVHDRTTVVAACGSGKTRTGGEVALRTVPQDGRLLIVAPTLDLISQNLREYRRFLGPDRLGRLLAVCSDTRAVNRFDADQAGGHVQVTTSPRHLATLLAEPGRATVAVTYQSLWVLREAHQRYGLGPWSLMVVDEAHRSAGGRTKAWAILHDDGLVPAAKRLYMTATPRILGAGAELSVSMDDEKTFGPVCDRLTFGMAIAAKILAEYELLIPVITDEEIHRLVAAQAPDAQHLASGSTAVSPGVLALQVAVLKAAAQYGLRRIIVYCNTVAAATAFAATLHHAMDLLDPDQRPMRLVSQHVSGTQRPEERRPILARLGSDDPGLVVVSNAEVLTEGIDVPAVDCVVFAEERRSPERIAQAVGRALRTGGNPDKIARILVPVMPAPGESAESALETSDAWAPVWNTVKALRSHDERLAEYLDRQRYLAGHSRYHQPDDTSPQSDGFELPAWIRLTGGQPVPDGFARAITVQMVQAAAPSWEESYGQATAFAEKHDHLLPSRTTDVQLCNWLTAQRKLRNRGVLDADRIARLDAIGMPWTPKEEAWSRGLAAARSYHQTHGTLVMPANTTFGNPPVNLSSWLSTMRLRRKKGTLPAAQIAEVDALGLDWTSVSREENWSRVLAAARSYHQTHGTLTVPVNTMWGTPPINLYLWVANIRQRRKDGTLSADRIAVLDALDFDWAPSSREDDWPAAVAVAESYYQKHGNVSMPRDTVWGEPSIPLGQWIARQRQAHRDGTLTEGQISTLDALGMVWAPLDDRWMARADQLREHLRRHGGALPTRAHGADSLCSWLERQRNADRAGNLAADRNTILTDILGQDWAGRIGLDAAWTQQAEKLRRYLREHPGTLPGNSTHGELYRWVRHQQAQAHTPDALSPDRSAHLADLLGPDWADQSPPHQAQTRRLEQLTEHLDRYCAEPTPTTDASLAEWLATQRRHHRAGSLDPQLAAQLQNLIGGQWAGPTFGEEDWTARLTKLDDWLREHDGTAPTPNTHKTLSRWHRAQVRLHRNGDLPGERAALLAALLGPAWAQE
jgi:superfamily II DNA or RNA helicase